VVNLPPDIEKSQPERWTNFPSMISVRSRRGLDAIDLARREPLAEINMLPFIKRSPGRRCTCGGDDERR